MGQSKRREGREFYLRLAIQERWSKRDLERQFNTALFERAVLSPPKVSPTVRQSHPEAASIFKDAYAVEFLNLPQVHLVLYRLGVSNTGWRTGLRARFAVLPSRLDCLVAIE